MLIVPLSRETEEWWQVVKGFNPITYQYAAVLFEVSLREAIERINTLVQADKLRGTDEPYAFKQVPTESWWPSAHQKGQ
jgi:hypothetical protein